MVAGCPLQYPASVVDLAEQKSFGVPAAGKGIVRRAVLLLAKQDIPLRFAHDTGQKLPLRREEGKVDAALRAGPHQGRGGAGIGEAEDAF